MEDNKADIAIIGAGPAGLSAALRAAWLRDGEHAKFRIIIFESSKNIGGFANWEKPTINAPGWTGKGAIFIDYIKNNLQYFSDDVEIIYDEVIEIHKNDAAKDYNYKLKTKKNEEYICDALIVTTGIKTQRWELENLDELNCFIKYKDAKEWFKKISNGNNEIAVLGSKKLPAETMKLFDKMKKSLSLETLKITYIIEGCKNPDIEDNKIYCLDTDLDEKNCLDTDLDEKKKEIKCNMGENKPHSVPFDVLILDFHSLLLHPTSLGLLEDSLEKAGCKINNGFIEIDTNGQAAEGIFAAGDITGMPMGVGKAIGQGSMAGISAYNYVYKKKYDALPPMFPFDARSFEKNCDTLPVEKYIECVEKLDEVAEEDENKKDSIKKWNKKWSVEPKNTKSKKAIMELLDLLKTYTEVCAPTTFERPIIEAVKRGLIEGYVTHETPHGNLIIFSKDYDSKKPTIMFQAHLDEVGFKIKGYTTDGFLTVAKLSHISINASDHEVIFFPENKNGLNETGIILGREIMDEHNEKKPDFYVDIGAKDEEEARKLVPPYSVGAFIGTMKKKNKYLFGKSFDDRVGCAIITYLLNHTNDMNKNIVGLFTAREEGGGKIIKEAASVCNEKNIYPDLILNLEVCPAGPTPFLDEPIATLGKGVVLVHMDEDYPTDIRLSEWISELAVDEKIVHQHLNTRFGGGEAHSLATEFGCLVFQLCIPERYIHSPISVISEEDLEEMKKLCEALIMKYTNIGIIGLK